MKDLVFNPFVLLLFIVIFMIFIFRLKYGDQDKLDWLIEKTKNLGRKIEENNKLLCDITHKMRVKQKCPTCGYEKETVSKEGVGDGRC